MSLPLSLSTAVFCGPCLSESESESLISISSPAESEEGLSASPTGIGVYGVIFKIRETKIPELLETRSGATDFRVHVPCRGAVSIQPSGRSSRVTPAPSHALASTREEEDDRGKIVG